MKTHLRSLPLLALRPLACLIASGQLFASSALAGIADDIISINDVAIAEGESGTTTLTFNVTRSTNTADFSLNWATADGSGASAAVAPADYAAGSGTLNFTQGGALFETVSVTVNGDTSPELDETFFVNLSSLAVTTGTASLADAQGLGTITDEDRVAPVITTNPVASLGVVAGTSFTLTAAATGTPAPTYRWYTGTPGDTSTPVSGGTSATLTTSTAVDRSYWVRATNSKNTADSTATSVTVPEATNALLSGLTLNTGTISPVFNAVTLAYSASEAESVTSVQFTPTVAISGATVTAVINGGAASPVTSGSPVTVPLTTGTNTVALKVTATNSTTTKTYNLTVVRAPQVYTSAIRDILEPNQRSWPTGGVVLGDTKFVNLGLQGVGRVPANAIDAATGESLGSISDMQVTGFTKNPDGTYSGTLQTLPDRGYNSGTIFSNYAARLNTFTFNFTPYTSASPTTAQNQLALTFTGSTRFTYDHDSDAGTAPVFTSGQLANGPAVTLFGTTIPVVAGITTQSDGPVTNRLTLDTEGLILDSRPGRAGSGWIGDEYGAYVYHFNAAKQLDGQLQLPAALVPHSPVGTNNHLADPPLNGRRINQGMEGIAQSPDGTRLFALLQSATIQDSGNGNQGRSNTRLLVYDISTSDAPSDPIAQYIIQLPRADDTGSTTNGTTVNRNCAQSAIIALSNTQFLVLSREGNGRGVPGSSAPVFKSILLADLSNATNIDGAYDAEGNAVAPAGTLAPTVTPIAWTEALNLLGKLNLSVSDAEKFGLNLNGGNGDINTLCEKWEALAMVPASDPVYPNDYFLFVGNDNDFLSTTGSYMDGTGALQAYDGGLENDTIVLAYRVRAAAATPATIVSAGDTTQTSSVLWASSKRLGDVTFSWSTDASFTTGTSSTIASVTDTAQPVKVAIGGLTPNTTYYYRAVTPGDTATGQFQTAATTATLAGLRFGVSGDQRGELAPFPSIKNAAGKNLGFFLQLGDNIYGDVATPDLPTAQARSLSDYRIRHNEIYSARYGMNTFSELRRTTSVLATIDDHEVINDFSGGEPRVSDPRFSADTGTLISDTETFNNGIQAFREYMPMENLQYGATGDPITANRAKLYRYNTYGKDAATFMLDTRSFRSAPVASINNPTDPAQIGAFLAASFAPGRTMLGAQQKADLKADLLSAKAAGITWKFIFCPEPVQNFGPLGGEDRYEGYAAERTELLKFIDDNQITNVVFVAADFHGTAVNRISYQMGPGQPQIQTNSIEIITGSVAYDKPFGPTIVDLATTFGLISAPQRAFYDALTPAQALQKEGFVQTIINGTLNALGYNPLTLFTNPLPSVSLVSGAYTATHSYGWTEFNIDAATQKLNLKTWGIAPYSKAELDADPLAITSRTPAIVQELDLTPKPLINDAATAGFSLVSDTSPLNLTAAAGVSPAGGTFSGNGIAGDTFDPALAPLGSSTITYTAGGQSVSFTITTTAAPTVAAVPTHALTTSLKSSIVLSDNGSITGSGGAEIPAFDPVSKRAFAASNVGIQVVDLSNPSAPVRLAPIDPTADGLGSKDVSHVIVKNGVLAVSLIASPDKTLPGKVAFYNPGTGALLGSVSVGAVPDQLTFTPDGTRVLVANEGELPLPVVQPAPPAAPLPLPAVANPEGSVSIIDISGGFAAPAVVTANFSAWNGQEEALRARGVRVFPGYSAQLDLEPEYVAIAPDGLTAMVTLQEANAVATLDIATATFTGIKPLGLKNFAPYLVDYSDRDGTGNTWSIKPVTGLPVYGMFMPDGISSYQSGGQNYYITSNEGDDRNDFLVPAETIAVAATTSVTVEGVTTTTPVYDLDNTIFPTETTLKGNAMLGRLTVSNIPGLRGDLDNDGDIDRILSYGGRSFSILDANGKRIFDSGDLIDRVLTTFYPALYDDGRSDNKSAEPEGVSIAVIDGKTYAFIGLERSHSVMVFDVTDPANVTFTTLATRAGDLNPEGMLNISAADSPTGKPLLLVANEVSFTLTTYELAAQTPAFQVQLLHYYGESGLLGIQTAPLMGALIDKFDDQYPNTLVIGEGDSFIPGPWLVGGADPSLNRLLHTGTFTTAADSTATPMGQADIAIMNAFNTTVSALGNHEFDLGSPVLAGALFPANPNPASVGNWVGARFPIITANLDFASDSSLRAFADATLGGTTSTSTSGNYRGAETTSINARIAPYAIKTIGGEKIGFVGATTWDLLTKSSPNGTRPKDDANSATSDLQEVAAYLQSAINSLKATGVNKIIMVDQLDTLQRNKDLASLLTGVDVMVAGGGHERMGDDTDTAVGFNGHDADFISDSYPIVTAGADGKPTLIVTTDTEYSYLGRLVVNFDANGELVLPSLDKAINGAYAAAPAIVEAVYNNGQTAAQIVAASPMATRVKTITDAINTVIQTKDGLVYGYTKVYMEGDRVFGRTQEVNLGDVTADANAAKAKAALGLPSTAAVFSLKNGGGLRASLGSVAADGSKIPPLANPLTGKPAGAISRLDVENALRFDNKLVVFDTTPAGLLGILNFAAGLSSGPTAQSGGYPQVGNIRFSYEASRPAGQKVRSAVLIDDNGKIVSKIVENGAVLPGAPATIPVVALNFTANGGDGYPIKFRDPAATTPNTIVNNETSNFRFVLNDGTLSAPVARNLDFTAAAVVPPNALGEQQAFSDYLTVRHNTLSKAYDEADTAVALDTRIQQIPSRSDTVLLSPVEIWRLANFGNSAGSGTAQGTLEDADSDTINNLFEFAFGTDPVSNLTGAAELTYTGTLAGNGTLTLPGQPITKFEPIANNVDFRAVFVRRKDYLAAGLTYTPQFSTALSFWQDSSAVPTVLADDGTWQVVSVPYTRSIAGRKATFFRIAVDLAPAP